MPDVVKSNLGPVTAYADAVKHGYTGSREDFGNLLAGAGKNLTDAVTAKDAAQKAATDAASSKQSAADSLQGAQTAQSAAEKAVEDASAAKNAAETAKAGAEAAQTAAENSNTAAKNSADAAAASSKSASDTAGSIKDSLDQIAENKAGVSQLKEATAALKDGKISKFYANSQGNTNLPDSDDGRIMDLKLYGKSEQTQYSGKNLLPRFETTTSASVTFAVDDNGVVTANGTATGFAQTAFELPNEMITKLNSLVGTTLYLSGAKSAKKGRILLHLDYKDDSIQADSIYNYASNSNTSIALKGTVMSGYAQISGESGTAFSRDVFYPMLSTSSDTAYEPYVGGIPSPNPEYPQEIKSVVKPVVKVCGKNLVGTLVPGIVDYSSGRFDGSFTGCVTSEYIPVQPGEKYTIQGGTDGDERWYYDADKVPLSRIPKGVTKTIEVPAGAVYMRISAMAKNAQKFQIERGSTATDYQPYIETSAKLPYTLNAIPVSSGGNVTIDGQQYIADYVDVERGKLVKIVEKAQPKQFDPWGKGLYHTIENGSTSLKAVKCDFLKNNQNLDALFAGTESGISLNGDQKQIVFYFDGVTADKAKKLFEKYAVYYSLATPTETDLTADEIAAFKALVSYYPVTNVAVTSDQLDGYTVFDYPISLAKGYDYIKQQLGDTRDYLYGIDLMTAEAYVNSEYAAALAEIEV